MKKLSVIIASVLFSFGVANAVAPQGDNNDTNQASHGVSVVIPKVALVDIEGSGGEAGTITLQPSLSAMEAGAAVDFSAATNSDLWLNYTSIVGADETRRINVSLNQALPTGLSLELVAGNCEGATGTPGDSEDVLTLSTQDQSLVAGIGSVFTGQGSGKGHNLTYTLKVDNGTYSTLQAKSTPLTVTYTITGDAANIEQ